MAVNRSLINPTGNPALERALRDRVVKRGEGGMGELEPLAVRLGLIQDTTRPRLRQPQLLLFASDHGLAVEGVGPPPSRSTAALVQALLALELPVATFAQAHGLALSVVDSGVAESVPPHARLLARKIAHGTRNARVTSAMSLEQAHAAIRAGMEIADSLPGNALACAGVGVGTHHAAALVLHRLGGADLHGLLHAGAQTRAEQIGRDLSVLQAALQRHRELADPVEVLAAYGGFEIAMMVGAMLVAASKRHLVVVDGMAACAALLVASRIAAAVTDYCLFTRSTAHRGLDAALAQLKAGALLELGLEAVDGTGAALAWPLVRSAAELLSAGTAEGSGETTGYGAEPTTAPGTRP